MPAWNLCARPRTLGAGIFQKQMFEWLVACEFAVADLSTGNPNVYYELGVRHGRRPYSTVLMFRQGWRLPLDVAHSTALEYPVDEAAHRSTCSGSERSSSIA